MGKSAPADQNEPDEKRKSAYDHSKPNNELHVDPTFLERYEDQYPFDLMIVHPDGSKNLPEDLDKLCPIPRKLNHFKSW